MTTKRTFENVRPIFIGGCPRSGTTMLGSILGGAEGCVVTPESHFKQTIPAFLGVDWDTGMGREQFLAVLKRNFRFRLWETAVPSRQLPEVLKPEAYRVALCSLVDAYAESHGRPDWQVWIDHTPQNIQDPVLLRKIFPRAKFIHLVRDPRGVAASLLRLDWGPDTAAEAALFWAQKLSYGLAVENAFPEACLRVRYEDVLRSSEETVQSVCEFCGLRFEAKMLSGNSCDLPGYTRKQHALVGSELDPSRVDSWKNALDVWQFNAIERRVGDLMTLMGYERISFGKLPKPTLGRRLQHRFLPLVSCWRKTKSEMRKRFHK